VLLGLSEAYEKLSLDDALKFLSPACLPPGFRHKLRVLGLDGAA
jgi:hypothetical protein